MVKMLEDIYTVVEKFLAVHKFIAGDELTIADISTMTSLSSLEARIFCQHAPSSPYHSCTEFCRLMCVSLASQVVWPPKPEKFPLVRSYMETCTKKIPPFAKVNSPEVMEMWKKVTFKSFKFELDESDEKDEILA